MHEFLFIGTASCTYYLFYKCLDCDLAKKNV